MVNQDPKQRRMQKKKKYASPFNIFLKYVEKKVKMQHINILF